MKKIFISFLIMTVMLTNISLANISSVQAATIDDTETTTDKTIKVSLDNIRDIMIDNSSDIKLLDNNLKVAKETYTNAKSTYTSEDKPTKGDYTDADGAYDSTGYGNALTAYNTAKKAYEKAKDDLETAKNNYEKGVEDKVYAAQEAFISYLYDLSIKQLNEDTVKSNEKKEHVYKLQYESGFISKNEYTSKLQGNTSVNDLNTSKNTEELERIKLCNTLGINPEENIKFSTDINVDFLIISKINYENDLNQMIDNNLDIKLKKDNIDALEDEEDSYDDDDIYDYNVDNAKISLKQVINSSETDFKGKYNELMTSYNSIKSSYDAIMQQQKEYQITQTKYDYGFISKNGVDGVDTAKLTLDKANANFIKARNECYLKYLKYIVMKEGY